MNDVEKQHLEKHIHALSHDLQSPISKIITISELLSERAEHLDDIDRDYLRRMNDAGRQLKQMVDELSRGSIESFQAAKSPDA